MTPKVLNKNLNLAKASKKDEFYTQLADIEKELAHYTAYFRHKTVLCNCDDPATSNFVHYFHANFHRLCLKELIATSYGPRGEESFGTAFYVRYTGQEPGNDVLTQQAPMAVELKGDGDFRSAECLALLKQCDVVVTNPPFSLFREYLGQLMQYNKAFLVIGHQNAIIYKEVFSYVKANKLWLGVNNGGTKWFEVKDDYDIATESRKKVVNGKKYFSMGSVVWFTNLNTKKRHQDLPLTKRYNADAYPTYDNYDAIEVARFADIPMDYKGVMGVPITFLDKYNPEQFEIVGSNRGIGQDPAGVYGRGSFLKGKETFKRLFIRNKRWQGSQASP